MNKSNVRPRRSTGKDSPLSKRPKLDFTIRTRESPRKNNNKESQETPNGSVKEKTVGCNSSESKKNRNPPASSDWDDDFSGDMLEKVCLIADLSQAIASKQTPEKNKNIEDITPRRSSHNLRSRVPPLDLSPKDPKEEFEKLKIEFEKLQEKFKTKEGEVHILRSQLKQNEDAKQAVALLNIKTIEDLKKGYNEKISQTEKELETTKSKLLFKDMEYKTLSERCRQLEYNINKSKAGDDETKNLGEMTQSLLPKTQVMEVDNTVDPCKDEIPNFNFDLSTYHEGKSLAKILCPEFFKYLEESSVVPYYNIQSNTDCQKLDFDKREKYKWTSFPKQNVFIKDLYSSVTCLFTHNTFHHKEAKETIQSIFQTCFNILTYTKEVLLFLENLQMHNSEFDDADQLLLENENEVKIVTMKNLLNGIKLNEEECCIEGRRTLALLCVLIKVSSSAFDLIKQDEQFFKLLKNLATAVGNLKTPLRYSGLLLGISIILQRVLEENNLDKLAVTRLIEVVEEIIFARPKLDVLREVVKILATGKRHLDFLQGICRKASVESCALYMDSKLKQAMFFTKDACPLKLLCMQIMGLSCMPSSQNIRTDITGEVIKWLNNTINTFDNKDIKWLPINSPYSQRDRCFNVTECLLHLLTLCLQDYNILFSSQELDSDIFCKTENERKKDDLISVIGHGVVLLKRILKSDQRQLQDNTYFLRFGVLLKSLIPSKTKNFNSISNYQFTLTQKEAISWITDLLENDLRNQECSFKQNTSILSDIELLNALKLTEDSKIY